MPPATPPTNSWPSSKIVAVTLGIILGLILLAFFAAISSRLFKRLIGRWIFDRIVFFHDRECCCCRFHPIDEPEAHPLNRHPANRHRRPLSMSSTLSSEPPSIPPRPPPPASTLLAPQFLPTQRQLDIPRRARSGEEARVELVEPRAAREPSPAIFSSEEGNERINYRPPYATSVPASDGERSHETRSGRAEVELRSHLRYRDA